VSFLDNSGIKNFADSFFEIAKTAPTVLADISFTKKGEFNTPNVGFQILNGAIHSMKLKTKS
jgi:hypothetical protein